MNSNLKNVCFIPAKSNSIRLPKKNKINFFGKPLITYTIKSAIEAKCFKKIIVSTDDKEIIKIARSFGVEVDIRKKKLSKNKIKVSDVLIDFIKRRKKTLDFNVITCLFIYLILTLQLPTFYPCPKGVPILNLNLHQKHLQHSLYYP